MTQTVSLTGTATPPHLAFITPPPDPLKAGQSPGIVTVGVELSDNQVTTTFSGTITLTVTGPNSYSKVYSAATSEGVATFNTLEALSTVGSYTYTATDTPDGLLQVVATETVRIIPPFGWLDRAIDSATGANIVAQSDSILITGWAVDPQQGGPVTQVKILIDGKVVGNATLGLARADVAARYNNPAYTNSGWTFTIPASGFSLTSHTVSAVATDALNVSTPLNSKTITIATARSGLPVGRIDKAVDATTGANTVAQSGQVLITGWAADPQYGAPLSEVLIEIDGSVVGKATLGLTRTDIATYYNNPAYTNSGWRFTTPASGLSLGSHTVQAIALGSFGQLTFPSQTFTVASTSTGPPIGWLDRAVDSTTDAKTVAQSDQILITGWAADPQQGAPVTQVQMLIDGNVVGNATLGGTRTDIGTYYNNPAYANSGWRFTTPASGLSLGSHTVKAVVTDALNLSTTLNSRTFTIAATSTGPPIGWINKAVDSTTGAAIVAQSGKVLVTGYAADPQQGAPVTQVQILIDGNAVGNATLGGTRTDIAAYYNNPAYTNSGWTFTTPASGLSVGTHTVSAIVTDSLSLSTTLASKTFTVFFTSSGPPIGWLDKAVDSTTGATTVAQSGQILITGWAADPQQGAPVSQVQILIDGNVVGTATLGLVRADIAAYYNNPAYKNSGWRITTAASGLSLGAHTVSAIVTDSLGLSTNLGPKTITVQ